MTDRHRHAEHAPLSHSISHYVSGKDNQPNDAENKSRAVSPTEITERMKRSFSLLINVKLVYLLNPQETCNTTLLLKLCRHI